MAEPIAEQRAASDPLAGIKQEQYDKYFTSSPDPWEAIVKINYGSDLTVASNVETQILMADPGQRGELEKKLLKALGSQNIPIAAVNMICRLLGLVGSGTSAKVLAPFLHDPQTADAARLALQAIPGEEISGVLRDGLSILKGEKLAGLIGTIAARHDAEAVSALKAILADASQPPIAVQAAKRCLEALEVSS